MDVGASTDTTGRAQPPAVPAAVPQGGLTSAEAAVRLARDGRNELPAAHPVRLWRRVAAQARDPLVLVLLAAAVLTIATGDWTDAGVIVLVIVVNTAVGVTQEVKAGQAIAALSQLTAPEARVLRDGEQPVEWIPLLVMSLVVGFFEAVFFRGFVQNRLVASFGTVCGVGGAALLYGLYHVGYGMGGADIVFLVGLGVVYAVVFALARNVIAIWPLLTPLGSLFNNLQTGDIHLPWASIAGFADIAAAMAMVIWLAMRRQRRQRPSAPPAAPAHEQRTPASA